MTVPERVDLSDTHGRIHVETNKSSRVRSYQLLFLLYSFSAVTQLELTGVLPHSAKGQDSERGIRIRDRWHKGSWYWGNRWLIQRKSGCWPFLPTVQSTQVFVHVHKTHSKKATYVHPCTHAHQTCFRLKAAFTRTAPKPIRLEGFMSFTCFGFKFLPTWIIPVTSTPTQKHVINSQAWRLMLW